MKVVFAIVIGLLIGAASLSAAPRQVTETVPSWLYMEPGWAQACATQGGCIPMTRMELEQLVAEVAAKAKQQCNRSA